MKHISKLFFLSILTFLVACGGNDNSIEGKKASLEQLKKQALLGKWFTPTPFHGVDTGSTPVQSTNKGVLSNWLAQRTVNPPLRTCRFESYHSHKKKNKINDY